MKKTIVILALALIYFSCKTKEEKPKNYVILSGNISNTKGGELKISSLNGFTKL